MSKFKVGDRVKAIRPCDMEPGYVGCYGTVLTISSESDRLPVQVRFEQCEDSDPPVWWCESESLELVTSNKTNMSILSKIKQITRSEPEKTFVEVGFLNDNEEITADGRAILEQILWDANRDKLKELWQSC